MEKTALCTPMRTAPHYSRDTGREKIMDYRIDIGGVEYFSKCIIRIVLKVLFVYESHFRIEIRK